MVADFFDIVMMRCISWQSSNDWVVSGPVVMGVVRMAWLLLLVMVVSFLVRIVMGCFLMVIIFMDSSIVRLLVISMVLRGSMMSTINFMPVFSLRLNLMMLNMVHVLTMIVVVRFTLVTRLMMRFVTRLMMRFVMGLMMGRFVMVIDCFRVGVEMQVGNIFDVLIAVVFLSVLVGKGVMLVPVVVVFAADPSGNLVLGMSHFLDVMLN